jgi:hypothetical protein
MRHAGRRDQHADTGLHDRARDGNTNAGSLRIVARTNLVFSAAATCARNEHLAVVLVALIAVGRETPARSQDR